MIVKFSLVSLIVMSTKEKGCELCFLVLSKTLLIYVCISLFLNSITSGYVTGIFLSNWIGCPIQYFGICYNILFHYSTGTTNETALIPDIVLRDDEGMMFVIQFVCL